VNAELLTRINKDDIELFIEPAETLAPNAFKTLITPTIAQWRAFILGKKKQASRQDTTKPHLRDWAEIKQERETLEVMRKTQAISKGVQFSNGWEACLQWISSLDEETQRKYEEKKSRTFKSQHKRFKQEQEFKKQRKRKGK
jgi:hypothetical protein